MKIGFLARTTMIMERYYKKLDNQADCWWGITSQGLDVPRYIKLINAGKMTLDGFITHEFALDEINAALDLFRSGKVGRIVIKMNSN